MSMKPNFHLLLQVNINNKLSTGILLVPYLFPGARDDYRNILEQDKMS